MGRRLGQHFLHDPAVLDRIVDALEPTPTETVLEIGPGRGALTRRLLRRVQHVVAIERDRALASTLDDIEGGQVTMVCADALRCDWEQLVRDAAGPQNRFKVVGNIPYYISTPLIEKALSYSGVALVVYTVQREVAVRLGASPGSKDYGALSIGVQVLASVDRLFTVRAGSFQPPPKVDSAVVRLQPREFPLVAPSERQEFRRFVAQLFGQRRKQLSRSLRRTLGLEAPAAARLLEEVGIDRDSRVETVSPQQLPELFRASTR